MHKEGKEANICDSRKQAVCFPTKQGTEVMGLIVQGTKVTAVMTVPQNSVTEKANDFFQ